MPCRKDSTEAVAQAVALTFLGTAGGEMADAAAEGMAEFFTQIGFKAYGEWKEEIVYFRSEARAATRPSQAVFPDGTAITVPGDRDPRVVFADGFWPPAMNGSPGPWPIAPGSG